MLSSEGDVDAWVLLCRHNCVRQLINPIIMLQYLEVVCVPEHRFISMAIGIYRSLSLHHGNPGGPAV